MRSYCQVNFRYNNDEMIAMREKAVYLGYQTFTEFIVASMKLNNNRREEVVFPENENNEPLYKHLLQEE